MIRPIDGALLTATVLAIASGQVLFKLAANQWVADGTPAALLRVSWFWWALLVYGGATLGWLVLLRSVPLSVAYPFFALAFFFVPVLSWWLLGEPLRPSQWWGAGLIALGVWVSVR